MHAQPVVCRKAVRYEVYTLEWSDEHGVDGYAIQSADSHCFEESKSTLICGNQFPVPVQSLQNATVAQQRSEQTSVFEEISHSGDV